MNEAKQKLILALETLAETMDEVDANGGELAMRTWVCGTAACVCGWQAIKNNMEVFLYPYLRINIEDYANSIADYLDDLCIGIFDNRDISVSIWCESGEHRTNSAMDSNLFTKEELLHPHLTDNTTAKDAADYIRLCIKKVEEY